MNRHIFIVNRRHCYTGSQRITVIPSITLFLNDIHFPAKYSGGSPPMFSPTSSGKSQTAPVSKSFHCHRTFRSHQIFGTCCAFHTHRNFKISRLYKEMIIKFIAQIHIFYFHFIVSEIQIQLCKPFFV